MTGFTIDNLFLLFCLLLSEWKTLHPLYREANTPVANCELPELLPEMDAPRTNFIECHQLVIGEAILISCHSREQLL